MLTFFQKHKHSIILIGVGAFLLFLVDVWFAIQIAEYEPKQPQIKQNQTHEYQSTPRHPIVLTIRTALDITWNTLAWIGGALHTYHQEILGAFTIFLAIATVFLAIYTKSLWKETQSLVEEAKTSSIRQAKDTSASIEQLAKAGNAMQDIANAMRLGSIQTARTADEMARTARATQIAADAAKKSADASLLSLRPWLTCHVEIADGLTYTEEGDARFQFIFEIKNFGHSPAMAIRFNPFLTLLSPQHESAIIRLQRMAELNRGLLPRSPIISLPGNVRIEGADLGLVLFPGETHTIKYGLRIKRDEIVKSCEDTRPQMNFWPILGGLIEYSYALASVRADTAFVNKIKFSDELFFKLDEAIPMEKLGIARNNLGEGFAT